MGGSLLEEGHLESSINGGDHETGRKLVAVLSCVLNKLVEKNKKVPFTPQQATIFDALKPPSISVVKYLERIVRFAPCSPEAYILALIYIDRIIQLNRTFEVTSLNIHRLLITSVMIAAKFYDDTYYNNAYYAKVGGVPVAELNNLEIEFLFFVDFNLNVSRDVFERYRNELTVHLNARSCLSCQVEESANFKQDKFTLFPRSKGSFGHQQSMKQRDSNNPAMLSFFCNGQGDQVPSRVVNCA